MNKNQIVYQLNSLLNKIKYYRFNNISAPEFNLGERNALIEAINFIKDENNDAENIFKIKQDYEQKLKEEIQEHCDHKWVKNWTWSCGGYLECLKCGKRQEFYERD